MEKTKQQEELLTLQEQNTKFVEAINKLNRLIAIEKTIKGSSANSILKKIKKHAPILFSEINKLESFKEITHIQFWDKHYLAKDGEIVPMINCEADEKNILTEEQVLKIKNDRGVKTNQLN